MDRLIVHHYHYCPREELKKGINIEARFQITIVKLKEGLEEEHCQEDSIIMPSGRIYQGEKKTYNILLAVYGRVRT